MSLIDIKVCRATTKIRTEGEINTSLAERLASSGAMVTAQRRLVCEMVEASEDHPDAEQLFSRAREEDAKISLATVYRVLKTLVDSGLVLTHEIGRAHV